MDPDPEKVSFQVFEMVTSLLEILQTFTKMVVKLSLISYFFSRSEKFGTCDSKVTGLSKKDQLLKKLQPLKVKRVP